MLYIPSSEAIQLIVVAEEVLASKVLHFVTILAGAVFAVPAKSTWHDVTLFQKVVPKSSAGYYGVVWAEFHKIKIGTGNYNIVMMIAGGVRGHRQVCRTLTNHYCENFKRGVNDSSGALTTEPPGHGVVLAYYPCGWFSMVTDTTRFGTGCDCMSTTRGRNKKGSRIRVT